MSKSSGVVSSYLILYNFISFIGWTFVLYLVLVGMPIQKWIDQRSFTWWNNNNAFNNSYNVLTFVQTAAILEVVHSLLGLVKSPVITTIMQVSSRLFLVWGVVLPYAFMVKTTPIYTSMVVAWSITEIVRYLYYTFSLVGVSPSFLLWNRYTLFYILYPVGAGSEAWLVYKSLPEITNEWTKWVYTGILLVYIPGFYTMYTHMITQRKKYLGKKSIGKSSPSSKRRSKKD